MSDKEISKAAREKRCSIQRNKDKDDSFLSSIMWEDNGATSLKFWRKKTHQSRILYPTITLFKNEGEIKTFQTYRSWKNSSIADPQYKK